MNVCSNSKYLEKHAFSKKKEYIFFYLHIYIVIFYFTKAYNWLPREDTHIFIVFSWDNSSICNDIRPSVSLSVYHCIGFESDMLAGVSSYLSERFHVCQYWWLCLQASTCTTVGPSGINTWPLLYILFTNELPQWAFQ